MEIGENDSESSKSLLRDEEGDLLLANKKDELLRKS